MATGLIDVIKRASMESVANAQMCDLRYGKVTSVNPLKVHITNLFTLPESMLIVPEHLTDYEVEVMLDIETADYSHSHSISDTYSGGGSASTDTHKHKVSGKTKLKVNNALKVNDKVALLRKQGGQSYFILDRILSERGD